MKPFHRNDGYVEVTAVGTGQMVELYLCGPGESQILHAHMTSKTAWRLGVWLILRWIFQDLFGIRTCLNDRKRRKILLDSSNNSVG